MLSDSTTGHGSHRQSYQALLRSQIEVPDSQGWDDEPITQQDPSSMTTRPFVQPNLGQANSRQSQNNWHQSCEEEDLYDGPSGSPLRSQARRSSAQEPRSGRGKEVLGDYQAPADHQDGSDGFELQEVAHFMEEVANDDRLLSPLHDN